MCQFDDIKKVFYVFEIHKILDVKSIRIQNTFNFPIAQNTNYKNTVFVFQIRISNTYI